MSCTAWHDSLTGRLYGENGVEDDAALTDHLEACASCRKTLGDFESVRALHGVCVHGDSPAQRPRPLAHSARYL